MGTMPVEFVNPFFVSVQRICNDTLKVPIKSGTPRLLRANERVWKLYQVSALISLSSAVCGLISLSFSDPVALALASALADHTFFRLNDNARDALGEVTNLIVGSAKRDLAGELVTISLPKVMQTRDVAFPIGWPVMILPFEMSAGRFLMQMSLMRTAPKSQAA